MTHDGEDSMATATPLSSLFTITSAHTVTGGATTRFESLARTMPPAIERNQAMTSDVVIGYGFQIGDWVWINNPREGQPHKGEIIGVTCN